MMSLPSASASALADEILNTPFLTVLNPLLMKEKTELAALDKKSNIIFF